jgi:hypothetical protein
VFELAAVFGPYGDLISASCISRFQAYNARHRLAVSIERRFLFPVLADLHVYKLARILAIEPDVNVLRVRLTV